MKEEQRTDEGRRSLVVLFTIIAALHIIGWSMLILSGSSSGTAAGVSIGTGTFAYLIGLRHAFDADHIAAIDNTTRKLINDGRKAHSAGFFFSLGHSTVVLVASTLVALGASALAKDLSDGNSDLMANGSFIGSLVSGGFLLLIAFLNIPSIFGIAKTFSHLSHEDHGHGALEKHLKNRGLLSRIFSPLAHTIDSSWKMYPLGILFGLGFDTASSIVMLAMAGASTAAGANPLQVIALPIIFAAGMSLGDTVDGIFMNHAYKWAFAKPVRKVYYNLVITVISVAVALSVGIPVLSGAFIDRFHLTGMPWDLISGINMENVGFLIVAVFASCWVIAASIWKFGRIEERLAHKTQQHH
jgi:high-affinity nickel-transport protein